MSIEVEAKSLELALVMAAGKLGVSQDEISYSVINENKGFLGLFNKKITIRAQKRMAPQGGRSQGGRGRGGDRPVGREQDQRAQGRGGQQTSGRRSAPDRSPIAARDGSALGKARDETRHERAPRAPRPRTSVVNVEIDAAMVADLQGHCANL